MENCPEILEVTKSGEKTMKAYGLLAVENDADIGDIKMYGLKSSIGAMPNKSGQCRTLYFNTSAKKRATRRIWKKRYRLMEKTKMNKEINGNYE